MLDVYVYGFSNRRASVIFLEIYPSQSVHNSHQPFMFTIIMSFNVSRNQTTTTTTATTTCEMKGTLSISPWTPICLIQVFS